jgi:hypothetical protein
MREIAEDFVEQYLPKPTCHVLIAQEDNEPVVFIF